MVFVQDEAIRYASKRFRFSEENLKSMLANKQNEKKQLFADVICSLYYLKDLVDLIDNNKKIHKVDGLEYLDDNSIKSYFGFNQYQLNNWYSKERVLLKKVLHHIALCYLTNRKIILDISNNSLETLVSLSPKEEKETNPLPDVCETCPLNKHCENIQ